MEAVPPNNHAAGSVDGFDDHAEAVDEIPEHPPGMPPPAAAAANSVAVDGAPQPQPLTLPPPTPLHRSNRKATSNDDGDNAAVSFKGEQMATAILLTPTDGGQVDGDSVVIDSPVVENQVETNVVQVHDPPPALPPPETADAPVVEAVVAIGNNATEKRGSDQVATDEGERAESDHVTKKLKTEEETLLDANNESAVTAAGAGASSGSSSTQQAGRKERLEFTAAEKLHILSLVESNQNRNNTSSMNPTRTTTVDDKEESQQPMTAKQIREKFNVSKSSLHRWKQQKSRLQTLVNQGSGMGDRKRDTRDLTLKLKFGLKKFAEENATKDTTEMLAITTPVIMAKAVLIQEDLIKGYEEAIGAEVLDGGESNKSSRNKPLTEEEYNAIKEFKVTKGWAGRVGSSMCLLSCPRVRRQKKKEKSTVLPNDDANKAEIAPAEAMGWGETSTPQTTEQAKANTESFLFQFNPNDGISKPKKDRREFTAIDKLQILEEMDEKKLKMDEVCAKWNTSKSSVFRWKIQRKNGQLNTMINDEKGGHSKRVVEDRLLKIKLELKMFVDVNAALPVNEQVPINSTILQMKASEARDQLLLQHMSLPSGLLTNDEVIALQNFKASKGWARKVAEKYGWKIANRRDDGLVDVGTSFLAERLNLPNNTGVDSATLASIRKNTFEEATQGNVPPQLDLPPGLNVPVAHDGKNEMNQDLVHPTTGISPAHNPPAPLVAQMAVVDGPRALGGFDSSSLQHLPPLHDPHAPPEEQAEQELVNETVDSVIDNITIAL